MLSHRLKRVSDGSFLVSVVDQQRRPALNRQPRPDQSRHRTSRFVDFADIAKLTGGS